MMSIKPFILYLVKNKIRHLNERKYINIRFDNIIYIYNLNYICINIIHFFLYHIRKIYHYFEKENKNEYFVPRKNFHKLQSRH